MGYSWDIPSGVIKRGWKIPALLFDYFPNETPVFDADFPAKNGCAEPNNHDVCECSRIVRFSCAIIWQQRSGRALQNSKTDTCMSSILNAIMLMLLRAQLG